MFRYVLKNILRRKGRSLFAVVGIGVGISAVISLTALSDGMLRGIQDMLNHLPGSHIVLEKGATAIPMSSLDDKFVDKIRKIEGVKWVEPFLFQMRKIPTYLRNPFAADTGDSAYVERLIPFFGFTVDGEAIKKCVIEKGWRGIDKSKIGKPNEPIQMLVGKEIEIAWKKHMKQDLPKKTRIFSFELEAVGVFTAGSYLRTTLVMPYRDAQRFMNKKGKCNGICVQLKKGADEKAVLAQIKKLSPVLDPMRTDEYLGSYEELKWMQQMVSLIGLIAAFAGAASVLITMISNIHERTREIGLLLAVGWKPSMIVNTIIAEGIVLSFLGGLIACALGVAEVKVFGWRFDFNPLPAGFPIEVFIKGLILSVFLGALGSALPAIRAARMRPVEALRYE